MNAKKLNISHLYIYSFGNDISYNSHGWTPLASVSTGIFSCHPHPCESHFWMASLAHSRLEIIGNWSTMKASICTQRWDSPFPMRLNSKVELPPSPEIYLCIFYIYCILHLLHLVAHQGLWGKPLSTYGPHPQNHSKPLRASPIWNAGLVRDEQVAGRFE